MTLEIADLRVHPNSGPEFEAAMELGLREVLSKSTGFEGATLHRCLETPDRYVLQVRWTTLADHTNGFRGSPAFAAWRAIVGSYFADAPRVEHFDLAVSQG